MFGNLKREKVSIYDEPINRLLKEMDEYGPGTPEYSTNIQHLETLHKLKAEEAKTQGASADTKWVVAGNLLGILTIVLYEQKHVMTSKAIGMVRTPK